MSFEVNTTTGALNTLSYSGVVWIVTILLMAGTVGTLYIFSRNFKYAIIGGLFNAAIFIIYALAKTLRSPRSEQKACLGGSVASIAAVPRSE